MVDDNSMIAQRSFAKRYGLQAMAPYDSLCANITLDELSNQVQLNWALVILAVSGGYLPERSLLDYALDVLDEDSDEVVNQLALLHFESRPSLVLRDSLISALIESISLIEWEYGFEQLFYVAVNWLNHRWEEFDDPALSLYEIDDDFYCLERGDVFNYHNFWPEGAKTRQDLSECMHKRCMHFLETEKERLRDLCLDDSDDLKSLDDIYNCWEQFNSYDLPNFIQDEHAELLRSDFRMQTHCANPMRTGMLG